jgi:hypothetical protein
VNLRHRLERPFFQALLASLIVLGLLIGLDLGFPKGGSFWDQYFTEESTIDFFCEASSREALFRHKVNTYSNIFYFLAGAWGIIKGLRDIRRGGRTFLRRHPVWSLLYGSSAVLVFLGSTLFHAGLTVWTEWADLAGVYAIALTLGCMTLHRVRGLMLRQHTPAWPFVALYFVLWGLACASIFTVKSWYLVLGTIAVIGIGGYLIHRFTAPGKTSRWFFASMAFTALAVAFFAADIRRIGCDPQAWIQPHGLWHISAALAFMLLYRFIRSSTATHAAL